MDSVEIPTADYFELTNDKILIASNSSRMSAIYSEPFKAIEVKSLTIPISSDHQEDYFGGAIEKLKFNRILTSYNLMSILGYPNCSHLTHLEFINPFFEIEKNVPKEQIEKKNIQLANVTTLRIVLPNNLVDHKLAALNSNFWILLDFLSHVKFGSLKSIDIICSNGIVTKFPLQDGFTSKGQLERLSSSLTISEVENIEPGTTKVNPLIELISKNRQTLDEFKAGAVRDQIVLNLQPRNEITVQNSSAASAGTGANDSLDDEWSNIVGMKCFDYFQMPDSWIQMLGTQKFLKKLSLTFKSMEHWKLLFATIEKGPKTIDTLSLTGYCIESSPSCKPGEFNCAELSCCTPQLSSLDLQIMDYQIVNLGSLPGTLKSLRILGPLEILETDEVVQNLTNLQEITLYLNRARLKKSVHGQAPRKGFSKYENEAFHLHHAGIKGFLELPSLKRLAIETEEKIFGVDEFEEWCLFTPGLEFKRIDEDFPCQFLVSVSDDIDTRSQQDQDNRTVNGSNIPDDSSILGQLMKYFN